MVVEQISAFSLNRDLCNALCAAALLGGTVGCAGEPFPNPFRTLSEPSANVQGMLGECKVNG